MPECSVCKTAIRGASGIQCDGVCKKVYHVTKKCSGIDEYSERLVRETPMLKVFCNDCMQYVLNVDMVLQEILELVARNRQTLIDYKHEFETSLKKNEEQNKKNMEAMEKSFNEKFKKFSEMQQSCDRNMEQINKYCKKINDTEKNNTNVCEEIKKTSDELKKNCETINKACEKINETESANKNICEKIEKCNERMCEEIKKSVNDANAVTKKTYAQATRAQAKFAQATTSSATSPVVPAVTNQIPLIIKPKEKQSTQKTKEDLNKKINPSNFKIKRVEEKRNGAVVIQSETIEEREKIKTAMQSEISENYEIKVPQAIEMQIVITDMNFKLTEEELLERIKKQNDFMKDSELEIIKIYETNKYNKITFNARLKIDRESYKKVLANQRINIGWDRCRVFDGIEVTQCFKCRGFNHKAEGCRNEEICYKCHGKHNSTTCQEEIVEKCINCIKAKTILNIQVDENHKTNDRQCPMYQNKLKIKKKISGVTA